MNRNRHANLLRVAAIGGVVYGHRLLVSVTYRNGQLSGTDALDYVSSAGAAETVSGGPTGGRILVARPWPMTTGAEVMGRLLNVRSRCSPWHAQQDGAAPRRGRARAGMILIQPGRLAREQ
jgi:hypothetical protein